jgi:alpha-amylase
LAINGVMMQYFEWYLEDNGSLWKQLREDAAHLKEMGVTSVWIPPCYKGTGTNDAGYGAYDLYDLGEFDQKGAVRTKYGTKEELLNAVRGLQEQGISVYADVVLNHKAGADETQRFLAVEVDGNDRTKAVTEPYDIEGWTRFTFPGRGDTYSPFKWSWEHFNGTDYNQENHKNAIYLILGENKKWSVGVAREFGNYDYLMFANIDYGHPDVQEEVKRWLRWFVKETGVNGIRLDAIKHINDWFMRDLLFMARQEFGEDFYAVGEYWEQDLELVKKYLQEVDCQMDLFDVGLNYQIHEASRRGSDFDLRSIFDRTLVQDQPGRAVTFVDNHDSQPGQSLESFTETWFKPMGYALILLRQEGYPCVFYGDYYGIGGSQSVPPQREMLEKLLHLRKEHAYGDQADYFHDANRVGWVRLGTEEHPAGCAVVISNGEEGALTMNVGSLHAGEVWADRMGNQEARVTIDEDGNGIFPVHGGSLSVYVRED